MDQAFVTGTGTWPSLQGQRAGQASKHLGSAVQALFSAFGATALSELTAGQSQHGRESRFTVRLDEQNQVKGVSSNKKKKKWSHDHIII